MRATVTSYDLALQRIRANGHLFDVGQISARALSQLYHAERLGQIKVSRDSWPLRGFGADSGEQKIVFHLTDGRQVS